MALFVFVPKACAAEENDFSGMQHSDMNKIFTLQHRFVFQVVEPMLEMLSVWYLPLCFFPSSCVLAWPCRAVTVGAHTRFDLEVLDEPFLFSLTEALEKYSGWAVVWRSPLWQHREVPIGGGKLDPPRRIALFGSSKGKMSIFRVACLAAFWSLSRTVIVELATDQGIECDKSWNLFETIFHVVKAEFKLADDDEVLDIVGHRLTANSVREKFSAGLLEIDEAMACLDLDDHASVKAEQRSTKSMLEEHHEVLHTYSEKRRQVREKKAVEVDKGKPKKGRAKAAPVPPRPKWPSHVEQSQAKTFIPPGAFIWRGLTKRVWCGHYPPDRRVSAPWDGPGGEQEAVRSVVARLWRSHISHCGLSEDAAPLGLFAQIIAGSAAASSTD